MPKAHFLHSARFRLPSFVLLVVLAGACTVPLQTTVPAQPSLPTPSQTESSQTGSPHQSEGIEATKPAGNAEVYGADVLSVAANGSTNAYQFSVSVTSVETGCDQYADWWEVLSEDGDLLYRRILLHPHVTEQPFTRSGGPVQISPDQTVYVRAHMHPSGYRGRVLVGSVQDGFDEARDVADFALDVETESPQPDGCAG